MQVSIITIFLNEKRFLAEAIESVVAQTFQDWELLLVDDGSADGSRKIAEDYAHRYPGKVRYFQHAGRRNLGKSSSRNLGLKHAKGRYVAFLDADDVLMKDKLERQVAILQRHPQAAMVYGRTRYWYGWTGNPGDLQRDSVSKLGVEAARLYPPPELMTRFLRDGGAVPCLCALVARRDVIEELGGFEESIQHLYEDQVLIAKICTTRGVFVEHGVGERYRQHADSTSAAAIRSREYNPRWPNAARLKFLSWFGSFIDESRVRDNKLERAFKRELRPYRYRRLYFCFNMPAYLASCLKAFIRGHLMERGTPWVT